MTRARLDLETHCAFCGTVLPGYDRYRLSPSKYRGWAGWELKNDAGVHQRYLPDLPEELCSCSGRGKPGEREPDELAETIVKTGKFPSSLPEPEEYFFGGLG